MTDDHGATWTGGTNGAPYYYIPDDVYQDMFDSGAFPSYWEDPDACSTPPESYTFTELFAAYDFHLRVDSNGKKTQFLFQVKITLELCFVEIENCLYVLTQTVPALIARPTRHAFGKSLVQIPQAKPYSFSLACAITSASSSKGITTKTGPKTSSRQI